jgi:hypothetical protein
METSKDTAAGGNQKAREADSARAYRRQALRNADQEASFRDRSITLRTRSITMLMTCYQALPMLSLKSGS